MFLLDTATNIVWGVIVLKYMKSFSYMYDYFPFQRGIQNQDNPLPNIYDTFLFSQQGAILEANSCNRIDSTSSQTSDTKTNSNTSPTNSANAEDQRTPPSSLLCINPVGLAHAIFAIHVDDTKAAFKFEANRFWPKSDGVKKPNPSVLVQALEEIATQGLIRECLFPLLWQVGHHTYLQ